MLLEIKDLNTRYGPIHALKGVNLSVNEGEMVTLIGNNGAGKTTLLNTLTGLVHAASGSVIFEGRDITNKPAHQIMRGGINMVPEGRQVFPSLTVEENLRLGAYLIDKPREIERGYESVYDLFPRLRERRRQNAGTLSGGEQQMLAIGRAMMRTPKVLLLDEPSLGLAPNLIMNIFEVLERIHRDGMTILLIEQNANLALDAADRGYVLETGRIVLEGKCSDLKRDPAVKKAYLGG